MVEDNAEQPKILALGEGIYVRQAIDNMGWFDVGEYVVAVDALEQPELEQEVLAAIRSTTGGKPVRYLLNTHTHHDHVALNEAFRRRGAEVVNQDVLPLSPQGRRFQGSLRQALMLPMGGAHTRQDCVVWVEPDRILFVGDIFGWGLIPLVGNLRDDSAELLLATYRKLADFEPAVVVPGHGPMAQARHLLRWIDYFNWLRETCGQALAAGKTDAQIMKDIAPPDDMRSWWRFLQWKHQDSVSRVLKSLRKGLLS